MTKNQRVRLQFIDSMFAVHGRVSTAQIIDIFGVQVACASRDLRAYAALNSQVFFSHIHLSYMRRKFFIPVEGLVSLPAAQFLESVSIVFSVPNLANGENVKPLPRGVNHE